MGGHAHVQQRPARPVQRQGTPHPLRRRGGRAGRARGAPEHPRKPEKRGLSAFRGRRPNRAPPAPRGAGKPFRPLRRRAGRPPFFRHPVPQGAGRRVRRGPRLPQSCAGARNTPTKAPSHRTSNASACARSPWRIRWTASSPSTGCCSPHTGIRSYFAKPFYTEQGLHAILILASLRPGSFGADAETRFASLMGPFERLIGAWRKG